MSILSCIVVIMALEFANSCIGDFRNSSQYSFADEIGLSCGDKPQIHNKPILITSHCYDPLFDPKKMVCAFLEPKAKCSHRNSTVTSVHEKKYTATFKGSAVLKDPGMLRLNLIGITNERLGVYVVIRCSEFVHKIHPEHEDKLQYMCYKGLDWDTFDYCDLILNSVYAIVPEGRQFASFRFLESLCTGNIPIIYTTKSIYFPFPSFISEEEWLSCVIVTDQPYKISRIAYGFHREGGSNNTRLLDRSAACTKISAKVCNKNDRIDLYTREINLIHDKRM